MAPRLKQDYRALITEYERRVTAGEFPQAIKLDFQERGIHWRTFQNQRTFAKNKTPQETPMRIEVPPPPDEPVSIDATDTPGEVHYGAVGEFDALPEGYAKDIQPMKPYSDAEEWALNKSMELYGFMGAIVKDQYGRILDGNQRRRIANRRGLGVPYTITQVKDDAHAIEIARVANTVRRHYTPEQRQELAPILRDQGFSYRAIAEALGVGVATVYRDVFGVLRERPEAVDHEERVPNGTPEVVTHPSETVMHKSVVPNGTPEPVMAAPTPEQTPEPVKRVKGRDQKSYPAKRPTGTKPQTSKGFDAQRIEERIKDLYMDWLRRCEDEDALNRADAFLNTLRTLAEGRAKLVLQGE